MITKQQEWKDGQRINDRCVICAKSAAISTRDDSKFSPYCEEHREWQRNYMRNYMRERRAESEENLHSR